MPACLVSTHRALFPFPGQVSLAGQVSEVCLAKRGRITQTGDGEL